MMSPFNNQVAVISGAGEGIGFEIARQLVSEGASVVLNDVDAAKADHASRKISPEGKCIPFAGDVSDVNVVRALVKKAVDAFGSLDMAIANAGITIWNDFLSYKPEDFYKVVSVNLGGSFFLAQAAAKEMIEGKAKGRILLMSSVTGRRAIPYLSAYSMTKAGLEGLARNLVAELAPHGIRVNAIAPGATVTPRNLADDPAYETVWGNLLPVQEVAFPGDIARAALFLLDPRNGQITGQTLIVDGGWTGVSPTPSLDFVSPSSEKNEDNP